LSIRSRAVCLPSYKRKAESPVFQHLAIFCRRLLHKNHITAGVQTGHSVQKACFLRHFLGRSRAPASAVQYRPNSTFAGPVWSRSGNLQGNFRRCLDEAPRSIPRNWRLRESSSNSILIDGAQGHAAMKTTRKVTRKPAASLRANLDSSALFSQNRAGATSSAPLTDDGA
jgi:hypothetical protein